LLPNLIIQWILAMKPRQSDLLKLEMVKMTSTPREINAILLSIKIDKPKLVNMHGCKLATNWQNFTEI